MENIGLGSAIQKMTMYICEDSTLSTFSLAWAEKAKNRFGKVRWNKKQEVSISTVDKLIEKYGIPTFCKIDVEGYELEVLKGLSMNIPYISFEYMTPENDNVTSGCLDYLHSIDNNIEVNYSAGDTMVLALKKWLAYDEAIELLQKDSFRATGWGDIYVRMTKSV